MATNNDALENASKKPRISIRARIMILALILIVPPMAERVVRLENARGERIARAIEEVASLTQRGTDAQAEIVGSTRALLQVVARAYLALPAPEEGCTAFLSSFTADVPWITGLSIVGPNDRITCTTRPGAIGLDLSDRDYIRAARRSRDFVLSGYLIGRVSNHPTIMAAYPALGYDGKADPIILASMELQWVERFANLINARNGATAFLLDAHGGVLSQLPGTGPADEQSAPDLPLMHAAISQKTGALVAAGRDGVRRIYGFSALPGTDARIVVGIGEGEALGRIDRELSIAYFQLVMFGLVAMLLTWFVGERFIIAPIRSLARTAASIGRGELDTRPPRGGWTSEFAPLAAAINDMATKLAERDRELRAANRHLQELALLDGLSGLPNRRSFDLHLMSIWATADANTPISLLMIDVDHFKRFNDTYGHIEGDNCLRLIGTTLATVTRQDFAARYGGEEFVMLLAGVGAEAAWEIAARTRAAIEALRIPHAAAPLGIVSVSIGVATLTPNEADKAVQTLIEAADAALYEAKRGSRNAVAIWTPPLAKAS